MHGQNYIHGSSHTWSSSCSCDTDNLRRRHKISLLVCSALHDVILPNNPAPVDTLEYERDRIDRNESPGDNVADREPTTLRLHQSDYDSRSTYGLSCSLQFRYDYRLLIGCCFPENRSLRIRLLRGCRCDSKFRVHHEVI